MPARDPASLQASIAAASQQPQTPVTAPAAAYPMRAEAVSSIMMPGDPGTPYARGEVMVPASRAMAAGSQPPPGQLPPPQAPPPPGFIATKSVMMDGRSVWVCLLVWGMYVGQARHQVEGGPLGSALCTTHQCTCAKLAHLIPPQQPTSTVTPQFLQWMLVLILPPNL
jgi:hypothetical protein